MTPAEFSQQLAAYRDCVRERQRITRQWRRAIADNVLIRPSRRAQLYYGN